MGNFDKQQTRLFTTPTSEANEVEVKTRAHDVAVVQFLKAYIRSAPYSCLSVNKVLTTISNLCYSTYIKTSVV